MNTLQINLLLFINYDRNKTYFHNTFITIEMSMKL